ncbi:MAG: EVE domain-containing protein [Cyclobacteriaceae bacterium]|nr:EVE domain-containing protein [Cyclobacteriaceae bacterium]
MNYWLVKTEPETFSWADLQKDKKAVWDGVRNFQARKNLKEMKKGDRVFIYHTGDEKAVVGTASVIKTAYPEPKDPDWVAVDLAPEKALKKPVSLAQIKQDKSLQSMVLVKAARLSVQPVSEAEYQRILDLSASA